jgi:hypothetical protein
MRTIEERKEEVLRRSDARIRRRNAITRRIAALCIPVVLTSAVLLLQPRSTPTVNPEAVTTTPPFTAAPESAMGSERTVTVSKNGQLLIHEDDTAVDAIVAALDVICAREHKPVIENFGGDLHTTPSSLGWKITVFEEGDSVVYTLDGSQLVLDGKTWLLTIEELQTLCRLVGLPPM